MTDCRHRRAHRRTALHSGRVRRVAALVVKESRQIMRDPS